MAERRSARGKQQDLTPDELAPAADEQGGALTIVGILGESPDSGSVRLFLDAQFQTYYEIPSDAILRRTRVPAERSPLGVDSSAVVVRKGTELTVHRATTRRVEEEFLAGDFTAPGSFAPAAAAMAGPRLSIACPSENEICISGIVGCVNSVNEICAISEVRCPTNTLDFPCITQDWICTRPTNPRMCLLTRDIKCDPPSGVFPCMWSDARCPSLVGCPPQSLVCRSRDCTPGFGGQGPVLR